MSDLVGNPEDRFSRAAAQSFVLPRLHLRGKAGNSIGNERGVDQSFATAGQGKYPGFALHIGKKCREVKR